MGEAVIEGGAGRRLEEIVETAEETKSSDFGSKTGRNKGGLYFNTTFPSFSESVCY